MNPVALPKAAANAGPAIPVGLPKVVVNPGALPKVAVNPGVLPKAWMTGGPKCMEQPAFQVQEYNPNFFILRQSGCIHYEKPFLYLVIGAERALLVDSSSPIATPNLSCAIPTHSRACRNR